MQANILWKGKEYPSMENCLIIESPNSVEITSTILGLYDQIIYKVDYSILTNKNWETLRIDIAWRQSSQTQSMHLESDGKGNWINNGQIVYQLNGCLDVDISLTPFTNTLPIRRLKLKPGQTQEILLVYFDLLEQQILPVRQRYTRVSEGEYLFQNVPNDFQAILQVDDSGFIVDYPSLFERMAIA